ncbi:hypothetical protein KYB31_06600 [Clostridium felsineum]|uniref:hypothetical protein n=1 Tax=Clostridium felsineum TaxID=36839 RepID=UPI00214D13F1|nr:hypothetical protein [Clostridium felsineum]MCR3758664.1 hypothetical protein [Clostridium felsineum]
MAFEVNYNAGGTIDEVSSIKKIDEIGRIVGFPQFTQPYNTMVKLDIPAISGDYVAEYDTPNYQVEIMSITVTCSGYGELDNYDIDVNGQKWFDKWYCSEVKEGLFIGTSTFVYSTPPNSKMILTFHNDSGSSKTLWFGIRMLVNKATTTTT